MADLTAPDDEQHQTRVLAVTSTRDGYEHLVAEEAVTPGSAGRYVAVCGHPIWAAVLACPAGPPCPKCAASRRATPSGRRRMDRPLMLARLLAWLLPARPRRARLAPSPLPDLRLPLPDEPHSNDPPYPGRDNAITQLIAPRPMHGEDPMTDEAHHHNDSGSHAGVPPTHPADEHTPHQAGMPAAEQAGATARLAAAADYRSWGWPVTLHCDQIWLKLQHEPIAVLISDPLAGQVTRILTARRCSPAVLAHPDAPGHRVLLAGEPYGVALPWPAEVRRITGTLLLPPSTTPRGPITWMRRPEADTLRLCREIDLLAALRTALTDSMPGQT